MFHVLSVVEFPRQARGVLRESWYNVNFDMNGVPTMRQHPIYKTSPQNQMILRDFDAPVDVGDYYVQQLTSYLQVNLRFTVKIASQKCSKREVLSLNYCGAGGYICL